MWPVRSAITGGFAPPLPWSFWRLLRTPGAHNRDRIAAAREVLDRGWGKAVGSLISRAPIR